MNPTFAAAARTLLAEQSSRLPDLSGLTVLVPHHHVAPPFLAELRRQSGAQVFLPPRLVTLPELAAAASTGKPFQPDSRRLVALHGFLAKVDWLDEAALWPLAQAMLDLLGDMDDAMLVPPADYAGFARQVEQACRRALAAPLEAEARLLFELWRAFHAAGPGSRANHALGLAAWLERATGPVYSLGLSGLSRMERCFLAECRDRVGLVDLPLAEPYPGRRALLMAAWRPVPDAGSLLKRAREWTAVQAETSLDLELVAAADLEDEARSAAARITGWLAEGRRAIAVIALDRLAARRLRAVLERDRVLLQDETGWTFATATVSHVLDRWFAFLLDGCYHRDLFDLLKSPFAFADLDSAHRSAAVAALERQAGRHDVVAGLDRFLALATGEAAAARPLLERLDVAARRFRPGGRRTLAGWLSALLDVLAVIGARPAFEADGAGRQLLNMLGRLAGELAADDTRYPLARWRGWLNLQLDRDTFVDDEIDSPVRLTHLAAARLRDFDAVVVLGADAAHLPGAGPDTMLNDALRLQLGLSGQVERREEMLSGLIDVLSRSGRALVTWRARQGVEPNPRSPWLDLLSAFHVLAYGRRLEAEPEPGPGPAAAATAMVLPEAGAPSLHGAPERLSASAWQTLVQCPYRYFARHGLGLGEQDAVAETMEKADYGELVHELLKRFHSEYGLLAEQGRQQLLSGLTRLAGEVFGARERDHYLAMGWRLRWQRHAEAYIDWALAREAAGCRWRQAETVFERELALTDAGTVILHGRLDRLDEGPDGWEVIDYKTQTRTALRSRLKVAGEDVQLPFYGVLTGAARAGLVALDDDKVDLVELPRPLPEAVADEVARLQATLAALAGGAPLPAHGAPETCRWCEMRGLCRRD